MIAFQMSDPERIGGFRVDRVLGQGGMGRVYLAEDESLRRTVAIKAVLGATDADRQRLLREGRIAASLNHPGICTIHQLVEQDGNVYIVMEHVSGRTLRDVARGGAMGASTVAGYGAQMAEALAYAHRAGVVHRDLKSANVMVTADGRLKILDFGLARRQAAAQADEATVVQATVTLDNQLMGTLHYMAPELLTGAPASPASDVWALGVILFEMAAGYRPYEGATNFDLSAAILNGPLRALPEAMPPDLAIVIHRALQRMPSHRYRDGGEVAAALAQLAIQPVTEWSTGPVVATAPASPVFSSIAVLPLRNVSGDPAQEFFSDGLTESLITDLGKIRSLKVISRTSVMQHKELRWERLRVELAVGVLLRVHVRGILQANPRVLPRC
jgi:serine/threonine protein kinase